MRTLVFLFISFTLLTAIRGQDLIRFQNITVEDGLSMGTVTGVQKDESGFIWIATAEGLQRFDGSNFKIFKHEEINSNSLSDSYIKAIQAFKNNLFIGNNSGLLDILDLTNYTFKTVKLSNHDENFDFPISCLQVFENKLIIGTEGGGLWDYDPSTLILRKYSKDSYQDLRNVTDIRVVGQSLLVSTPNKIYNCNDEAVQLLNEDNHPITCFEKYENGYLIGTGRGLFHCNFDFNGFVEVALPDKKRRINRITDILVDDEKAWVATGGGLLLYEDNTLRHFESDAIRPYSLVNNQLLDLYKDEDGILWIGSLSGLSQYSESLKKFGLIQYFDFEGVDYNNNVYYIYEDRNERIWLGTLSGGMLRLNSKNQIDKVVNQISVNGIETRAIRCLYEDSQGTFWVGTRDEGLFIYDPETDKFKDIRGIADARLKHNVIRDIFEDNKGRFWVATDGGIYSYNRTSNKFNLYQADKNSQVNNTIYQIEQDPKSGNLILASFRGGIQIFNPDSKRFLSLKHNPNDPSSISNNNVMCMAWLNADTLLLGTYGGGFNIMDVRRKKFTSIMEEDGLVNNAVYGILTQENGKVWLSTNDGIVQYNLRTKKFIDFKPVHYLQSTEFNEGAFCKSSKGYFYFGGVNGLNYFKPGEINYDTGSAPLYITEIRGTYTRESENLIDLSFLNSRLELDFMALYYVNPEGVNYKYRLTGYDQDWVIPKISNTAVYPRLSPGSYHFEVVAEDEFGQWSSKPINLKVFVEPPFWQKWWFVSVLVLLTMAIIYGVFKYRTKEIERGYRLQLVDSELRALRSQMNPHFIFNSLNSIQYFILKKQPEEAYTYLSKFASLMRKILQNSRLKFISIEDEIEWLELYLEMEKLRMDNNLDYVIDSSQIDDIGHSYIPTMLIQPYVENSIVHGLLSKELDRKINISFAMRDKNVLCIVEDNGIGREASKIMNAKRTSKHASAGMALTEKRLEILSEGKGEFQVQIEDLYENGQATGTKVSILVPMLDDLSD